MIRNAKKMTLRLLAAMLLLFAALPVRAHEATLGGSKWVIGEDRLVAAIELGASLFPEIPGLKGLGYPLDSPTPEQLKALTFEIVAPYLAKRLTVTVNGKVRPVTVSGTVLEGTLYRVWLSVPDLRLETGENRIAVEYRLLFEETGDAHVNLAYLYRSDAEGEALRKVIDYSQPVAQHTFESGARVWEFAVLPREAAAPRPSAAAAGLPGEGDAGGKFSAASKATAPPREIPAAAGTPSPLPVRAATGPVRAEQEQPAAAHPAPALRKTKPAWQTAGEFVVLGVKHILIGYDHIAFLVALIVIGLSLREVVKIVTAFTVAHSITLLLAALELVRLDSRLVESAIALSICYVALENILKKEVRYRWVLTFCFGLVHGFGFAGVLKSFIVGRGDLVVSVLSFNAGVEIGQLAIFLALFPLLRLAREPLISGR